MPVSGVTYHCVSHCVPINCHLSSLVSEAVTKSYDVPEVKATGCFIDLHIPI